MGLSTLRVRGRETMAQLMLISSASSNPVLPVLSLLPHTVRVATPDPEALLTVARFDAVVVDGRANLAEARQMCELLSASGSSVPVLLVLTEGGLAALSIDWGFTDVILDTAGPAEYQARLKLMRSTTATDGVISSGGVTIDESGYRALLGDRALDLTYTEFELLKFLVQRPGRVFSREQLLAEVWGYDYYGGTRTVDVHVRRLRAKLGAEHESLIGTVRNVGYRFTPEPLSRTG